MYAVDAASSETVWLEKCSTLIGSGTPAWALILRPRGFVCHSPPDSQTECRILQFPEFQLLADGDNIIDLDNSLL